MEYQWNQMENHRRKKTYDIICADYVATCGLRTTHLYFLGQMVGEVASYHRRRLLQGISSEEAADVVNVKLDAIDTYLFFLRDRLDEVMRTTNVVDKYPQCVILIGAHRLYDADFPSRAERIVHHLKDHDDITIYMQHVEKVGVKNVEKQAS